MASPVITPPRAILVDRRNFSELQDQILSELEACDTSGFDLETADFPHEALAAYRREKRKLIFDINRTQITGFSIHTKGSEVSYYFNIWHKDVENRLSYEEVKPILDLMTRKDKVVIAHNSVFELTMTKMVWDYDLNKNNNVICTMIMAVTAYNPDEYRLEDFMAQRLKPIAPLLSDIRREFTPDEEGNYPKFNLNERQRKLVSKVASKTSTAAFSYNGMINNITYSYGLKKMVERFFGYKMETFKDTLGGAADMSELTGEQTASYGADDAFWALEIYNHLLAYMLQTNPKVVETFFTQENPMADHYSQMWVNGMVLDQGQVAERIGLERKAMAQILRDLKVDIKKALPFKDDPQPVMIKHNTIYKGKNGDGYLKYRKAISDFAHSPDAADDYEMCRQVKSSITKSWALEKGDKPSTGVNLNYYVTMQTLLYDLLGLQPQYNQGKLTADKDARENLGKEYKDIPLIKTLTKLSGVEQRMSLYLTPYSALMNPPTGKIHPVVSSELATRRLAMKDPNGMQLAKRGSSAYIRGFFKPDNSDHVIISIDWSQVELVLIGEMSGDPEFKACYGQLPYRDLHAVAAAPLAAKLEGKASFTLEEFKALEYETYKKYRNDLGKGSNFEYWYSGGLWTLATKLKLSFEEAKELSARYAEKFHVAEQWRKGVIQDAARDGYVELPDHTRRVRFESTPQWAALMQSYFGDDPAIKAYGEQVIRKIRTRSGNQAVNAKIQGSCATLAKRSANRAVKQLTAEAIEARFMMPIHDELVWSVKRTQVLPFLRIVKKCMTDHPDIISDLVLDCTASVGNTFRPYDKEKAPFGQIELDELPKEFCITTPEKGRANEEEILKVLEYLKNS